MTKAAKQVLSDAMALDDSERAELAARLLDTLDASVDEDYVPAWEAEITQRVRELDKGTVKGIPWEKARAMIRQGRDAEAD
jgi:putative addiction module component (TIGR02574 family)